MQNVGCNECYLLHPLAVIHDALESSQVNIKYIPQNMSLSSTNKLPINFSSCIEFLKNCLNFQHYIIAKCQGFTIYIFSTHIKMDR